MMHVQDTVERSSQERTELASLRSSPLICVTDKSLSTYITAAVLLPPSVWAFHSEPPQVNVLISILPFLSCNLHSSQNPSTWRSYPIQPNQPSPCRQSPLKSSNTGSTVFLTWISSLFSCFMKTETVFQVDQKLLEEKHCVFKSRQLNSSCIDWTSAPSQTSHKCQV